MKTFKLLSTIAVAAILAPSAFAATEDGAAESLAPAVQTAVSVPTMDYANEISFTYGNGTIYEFAYLFTGIFADAFSLGYYTCDNFHTNGAYSLGWMHKVSDKISVGAAAMYNGGSYDMLDSSTKVKAFSSSFRVFAFMPTAKFYWFQKPKIAMYSRVACGVAMLDDFEYDDEGEAKDNEIKMAAQVSPVAVEFGGRFRGFLEYGMGSQGNIMLGVKYCF